MEIGSRGQGCRICVSVSALLTGTFFIYFWPGTFMHDPKWLKMAQNDISEMSQFTHFARLKFSAARHLKLFCNPAGGDFSLLIML